MRQRRRTLARSPNRHFVAQVVTWRQQVRAQRAVMAHVTGVIHTLMGWP